MAQAWVVRSGKHGERDDWAIENCCSGAGWNDVPDLSKCRSRDDIAAIVDMVYANSSKGARTNATAQLWATRSRIKPGDLVVMPMKTTSQIALGRVTSGYEYLSQNEDPGKRHIIRVDWKRTDVPRTVIKQDLLYTLGSALTIFAPSKNDAASRLEHIMQTGTDPGQASLQVAPQSLHSLPSDEVDNPETHTDIEEVSRDRVRRRIEEEFIGHGMADLIAAILEADGFSCRVSPPGADGGIDIVAGRGILGLESPRLVVQVKSGSQVPETVVRDLSGVVHSRQADQGLLVAWAGLTRSARMELDRQSFRLRAWIADDVIANLQRVYNVLDEDIRTQLPLKRVWVLADDVSGED